MGASEWTVFKEVTLPLITPGIVAAGLFGFTLSYDEFARTTLLAGEYNTLPLDINASMTQRIRADAVRARHRLYAVLPADDRAVPRDLHVAGPAHAVSGPQARDTQM